MEANYFTILDWFCHTLTWIRHGCTCVPHPEPSSHLSPNPIPLGHPSASRVFLISVIGLFVSVCLFFDFSRSLLIDSYIFSILFSRFLIIFTIIILNYFSGNLSIAPSFTWTSVFLVCSFICIVFLCLFIIIFFNLLCLRSPFPRPQGKLNSFLEEGWILSSFWFLPS